MNTDLCSFISYPVGSKVGSCSKVTDKSGSHRQAVNQTPNAILKMYHYWVPNQNIQSKLYKFVWTSIEPRT